MHPAPFLAILVFPAALATLGPGEQDLCRSASSWRSVIQAHVARYSAMEPADLYKLLHQGATGSEHAVESPATARRWMEQELTSLGDGPSEPMVDTIAPGGTHVRIHLRPFRAAGGDPEALLRAFIATANGAPADPSTLPCALETAVGMAQSGLLPWDPDQLWSTFGQLRAQGYPAVHHSEGFSEAHRPAYRVVAGRLLDSLLPGPVR